MKPERRILNLFLHDVLSPQPFGRALLQMFLGDACVSARIAHVADRLVILGGREFRHADIVHPAIGDRELEEGRRILRIALDRALEIAEGFPGDLSLCGCDFELRGFGPCLRRLRRGGGSR